MEYECEGAPSQNTENGPWELLYKTQKMGHCGSGPEPGKGLIGLALTDSQKCYKPSQEKSYLVDTSPKYTEYLFQ